MPSNGSVQDALLFSFFFKLFPRLKRHFSNAPAFELVGCSNTFID